MSSFNRACFSKKLHPRESPKVDIFQRESIKNLFDKYIFFVKFYVLTITKATLDVSISSQIWLLLTL